LRISGLPSRRAVVAGDALVVEKGASHWRWFSVAVLLHRLKRKLTMEKNAINAYCSLTEAKKSLFNQVFFLEMTMFTPLVP
jgi:hypothetical protein